MSPGIASGIGFARFALHEQQAAELWPLAGAQADDRLLGGQLAREDAEDS